MKRHTWQWLTCALALLLTLNLTWGKPAKWMKKHFPGKLTDAAGEEVSPDALQGKAVGLYFSAHWCPPCRAFTPRLVKYRDQNKDKFEVVFVSSDRSAKAQQDYMKETKMKWPAVGWRSEATDFLKKKYKVRGIPKLVILKPDGSVFTENGRGFVMGNKDISEALAGVETPAATEQPAEPEPKPEPPPVVAAVPTTPKPVTPEPVVVTPPPAKGQDACLKEHFPDGIIDIDGNAVSMDTLKGKVVGIYYSAHWCGPCRAFTPKLVECRNKNKDKFEVVFVSSDRSAEAQKEYMKEAKMEWPTMKWKSKAAEAVSDRYNVRGIPTLILLKPDGELLTREGRKLVDESFDMAALQSGKYKIVKEEYKCGRCDKMHTREKFEVTN